MNNNDELLRLNFLANEQREQLKKLDDLIVSKKYELRTIERAFELALINSQKRRF